MEEVLDALRAEEEGLFWDCPPEARHRILIHIERVQAVARQLAPRVVQLEAEIEGLMSLPPAPPIGAEILAQKQGLLEDLSAKDEVLRRQLGALVYEKGQLNATLERRGREMEALREEKAAIVNALGAALKRVTAEKEEALRGGGGDKGKRIASSDGREAQMAQMVQSQKRSIETLRHEVQELRARLVNEVGLENGGGGGGGGSGGGNGAKGGAAAAAAAAAEESNEELRRELEKAREQMALSLLHFQSDRASMATQLAVSAAGAGGGARDRRRCVPVLQWGV